MTRGIVLSGEDKTIQAKAKNLKIPVQIGGLPESADVALPWDKVLYTEPGVDVPWDLLPAGWHFLARWDAAVPLWRYGTGAADVGDGADRKRTKEVIRDLRVLLHSVELLFVADTSDGRALAAGFRAEQEGGGDRRLAFLRALYQVKPRVCVLPTTWMRGARAAGSMAQRAPRRRQTGPVVPLEVAPGVWVQVHEGQEDEARAQYLQRRGRRGRR